MNSVHLAIKFAIEQSDYRTFYKFMKRQCDDENAVKEIFSKVDSIILERFFMNHYEKISENFNETPIKKFIFYIQKTSIFETAINKNNPQDLKELCDSLICHRTKSKEISQLILTKINEEITLKNKFKKFIFDNCENKNLIYCYDKTVERDIPLFLHPLGLFLNKVDIKIPTKLVRFMGAPAQISLWKFHRESNLDTIENNLIHYLSDYVFSQPKSLQNLFMLWITPTEIKTVTFPLLLELYSDNEALKKQWKELKSKIWLIKKLKDLNLNLVKALESL